MIGRMVVSSAEIRDGEVKNPWFRGNCLGNVAFLILVRYPGREFKHVGLVLRRDMRAGYKVIRYKAG